MFVLKMGKSLFTYFLLITATLCKAQTGNNDSKDKYFWVMENSRTKSSTTVRSREVIESVLKTKSLSFITVGQALFKGEEGWINADIDIKTRTPSKMPFLAGKRIDVTTKNLEEYKGSSPAMDFGTYREEDFATSFSVDPKSRKLKCVLKPDGSYVFFGKNLELGSIILHSGSNYIFVADTLHVGAGSNLNSFVNVNTSQIQNVTVIAKCVVYNEALSLYLPGKDGWWSSTEDRGNFTLRAEKILFEIPSTFNQMDQLLQIPYLVKRNPYISKSSAVFSSLLAQDRQLIVRNIIDIMTRIASQIGKSVGDEKKFSTLKEEFSLYRSQLPNKLPLPEQQKLAAAIDTFTDALDKNVIAELTKILFDINRVVEADVWKVDELASLFRYYRKNVSIRMNPENTLKFIEICGQFDAKKIRFNYYRKALLPGGKEALVIIESDDYNTRYFALPTIAKLKPLPSVNRQPQKVGILLSDLFDKSRSKLMLNATLHYDSSEFNAISDFLKSKGLQLEKTLPSSVTIATSQVLFNGLNTKVIPYNENFLSLEIPLKDGTQSLVNLYTGIGNITLDLEFEFCKEKKIKKLKFEVDSEFAKLFVNPDLATNFSVCEFHNAEDVISLNSDFQDHQEDEGKLDHIEVMIEVVFINGEQILDRDPFGPFTLKDFYSVQGNNWQIPFFKKYKDYQISISGEAHYKKGIRSLNPMITKSNIIHLNESHFITKGPLSF